MTTYNASPWTNRWQDQRCFVIATGHSLRQVDVDLVRGQGRVIVVNKSYLLAPWADILFSIDRQFWDGVQPEFVGEKWTVEGCSSIRAHGLHWAESVKAPGVSPKRIHWTAGSGGTAISLAFLFGCNPIILLGFDMKMWVDPETGEEHAHHHEDYPRSNPDNQRFRRWRAECEQMAPGLERAGVRVINCTRDTALEAFERQPLEAVL